MEYLNLKELNLPDDVIENSGLNIKLIGELTGSEDEIVVITQLKRVLYNAYVCHLSNGYETRNGIVTCKVICDIPSFPKMIVKEHMLDVSTKTFNKVKYTMACLAEKEYDRATANWLH